VSRALSSGRLEDVEAAATASVAAPRSVSAHSGAQLHDSEHAEERVVKVEVEVRAEVRARLEGPGAARDCSLRGVAAVASSCLQLP